MNVLNHTLEEINAKVDQYTNKAKRTDYAYALSCGLMSAAIDSLFVGEATIGKSDVEHSYQQVNHFIQKYANMYGYDQGRLNYSIGKLEDKFKVPQDNVWKGAGIGVTPKNHHLADLAHHPTLLGLASAIVVQFLRIGTFVNKDGEWHFIPVETSRMDLIENVAAVILTGIFNWIATFCEKEYQKEEGKELPIYIERFLRTLSQLPILYELAKAANNWFGHLVSDMGGSKNKAGHGMGIPGIFLSLMYEIASLPGFKDTNLPKTLNMLYEKQKIDLRYEIPLYKAVGKQTIPVIFNEIFLRTIYFITRLTEQYNRHKDFKKIDWKEVVPFNNRTVDRMLTVSYMTLTIADTSDAATRAAIEAGGNWVIFAGKFVTRFNYVAAGRATLAIAKEISDESKEMQLLHEKRILSEKKAAIMIDQLQDFKRHLDEKLSSYMAEDIESFISGFNDIQEGLATANSDLVIKGNVTIQRVLGRKPQFENQKEFDELMLSDETFVL